MKNWTKKSFLLTLVFALTLALSGCGEASPAENLNAYDGGFFTLNVNPEWNVITESEFYPGIPDGALIAFTRTDALDGFYINVNITEESLSSAISSVDFGRSNINLAGRNLTDYVKKQEASVDLDGTPALVHIFTARLNPTEKQLRFIQLYTTKGQTGYTITGAMPLDTLEATRTEVGEMVTSFRLKQALEED